MGESVSTAGSAPRQEREDARVVCDCPGSPCEHSSTHPYIRYLPDPERHPLTMAAADELDAAGLYETARIARRYAVDRPRRTSRVRAFFARRATKNASSSGSGAG